MTTDLLPTAVQGSFDELGTPLRGVSFVVVDLETTGGSPHDCSITEVGAVRVRGGEVLGEFRTFVRPEHPIPPFVAVLTGITDAMVAHAPPISAVLPTFLEFAAGSVLVAHNAPFDVGFLRAAAARTGHPWPSPPVLDTVRLARRALTRDEAPNCRLATLATLFRAATPPTHRALDDARATVDVLHGLLERVGSLGVQSLEELLAFSAQVPPAVRRKRHLADGLPPGPGVYVFRDGRGRALYVGTSRQVRTRVRSYFTAAENRRRMGEMVALAERVDGIACATALEAQVRELRLIRGLQPPYNRRSRAPRGEWWLTLTQEPFPRLSVVRRAADARLYLGPFSSRRGADAALAALHDALPLRRCTLRLRPLHPVPRCALAGIGRCGAPCDGGEDVPAYAAHVTALGAAWVGDPRPLATPLLTRIGRLAAQRRYEEAAQVRDRLAVLLDALRRRQRLAGLSAIEELVAARPHRAARGLGWDVHVVRRGRLVAAAQAPPGVDPRPVVTAARASAETVEPRPGPQPAADAAETDLVARWLESPGVRLVHLDGTWSSPARGAGGLPPLVAAAGRPA